jgi:hypothetical protein
MCHLCSLHRHGTAWGGYWVLRNNLAVWTESPARELARSLPPLKPGPRLLITDLHFCEAPRVHAATTKLENPKSR